jgi:adenylosuccinate lyase
MAERFSPLRRARDWRRLWLALAEAQADLGVPMPEGALDALRAHLDDVDLDAVAAHERALRHDVMAHVHALGDVAPAARPIVHLGATSCFVTDNGDLLALRDALDLLLPKLAGAIERLAAFARAHADLPTLGFTHLQAAQPTTVGKRACLWLADLLVDLENLTRLRDGLRLRGAKGTTGTQASFLALLGTDEAVEALDAAIARAFDFPGTYPITGQTYSRKVDHELVSALASFGVTAHKLATDLRLLAHLQEVEEPFGARQIGSSAMPYKRNPMRAERVCALARHLVTLAGDTAWTAATQWLERTLDDSANRRIALAEAFLAADGVLEVLLDVFDGLVVHPGSIRRRLERELPFLATEELLLAMVAAGADRQEAHERLRQHSLAAAAVVKGEGGENDLVARIVGDPWFAPVRAQLPALLDPARFVGRAPAQVRAFLDGPVAAALAPWRDRTAPTAGLRV